MHGGPHAHIPAFGEEMHRPDLIWWSVVAVGLATTVLLWIYDRYARTVKAVVSGQ